MIGLWRLVYWASFGAALAVVLAGGAYAGFAYALQAAPFRGAPFDPARWQAVWRCDGLDGAACTLRRADCPRGPMVADLVGRHLAPGGLDRARVRALIGPPDVQGPLALHGIHQPDCDEVLLGMCSGFGIDWDTLAVCYDRQGHIAATGHVQH